MHIDNGKLESRLLITRQCTQTQLVYAVHIKFFETTIILSPIDDRFVRVIYSCSILMFENVRHGVFTKYISSVCRKAEYS